MRRRSEDGKARKKCWAGSQRLLWGHSQQGQVQRRDEEKECASRLGSRELLLSFVRACFLEIWRQMTDGSMLRREWEVRRGGGKPRHHGREH